MSVLLALAAVCAAAAAASLAHALAGRRQLRAALDRVAGVGVAAPSTRSPGRRGRQAPLVQRLAGIALAVRPGSSRELLALRLAGAGLGGRISPEAFLALQAALLLAALPLALAVAAAGSAGDGLLVGALVAVLALVVPDRILAGRLHRRQDAVLAELPGALDLLAVAVEAGLGFDAALARVSDGIGGPLGEELALMLAELRLGEARDVALERLAARVDTPGVTTFARAVARADQLGVSLAHTLRVQAADARLRRQAAAEERAGAAPVKMLFPTIVFIFPALFVVVLGPSLVSLTRFL